MISKTPSLFNETHKILRPFWVLVILSSGLGVVSGICITALLATINETMNMNNGPTMKLALSFIGLCGVALTCSTISNITTSYVGQRVIATLRKELAAKILSAPIDQLERYRTHRLIPVLVHDIGTISSFALSVAPLVISFTITVGCLGYLASLSWQILILTMITVIIGIGAQYLAYRHGTASIDEAREAEDELQKHYQGISEGAKELRIQRSRRHHMLTHKIQNTTQLICRANIRAANIFIAAETFGSMLFFAVIGLAIASLAIWPSTDKTVLGGFVLVMLYMKAPLEQLVNTLPSVGQAQVAFKRITELAHKFSAPESSLLNADAFNTNQEFKELHLHNISYVFPPVEGSDQFRLGPIDLTIKKGEIVFIVGENGCGKTTLIKLLLGLYAPANGQLILNGQDINDDNRDDYRQLFTTIFSDYYLFDDFIQDKIVIPENANHYLKRLEIDHKVSVRDGKFTTTDLSTGQRKRLALINAWIEKRPVLVFDEWAADQDPTFRRIFYTEILPELKRIGKTIIVISHDDRYFDIADQLVRMNAGQIMCAKLDVPVYV